MTAEFNVHQAILQPGSFPNLPLFYQNFQEHSLQYRAVNIQQTFAGF
jgi:hypothetical protein